METSCSANMPNYFVRAISFFNISDLLYLICLSRIRLMKEACIWYQVIENFPYVQDCVLLTLETLISIRHDQYK